MATKSQIMSRYPNDKVVSVKDFGAVGDGVTDDTAAIVSALAGGGTIMADGLYVLSGATLLSLTGLNYFNIISGTRLISTPSTEFRITANQLADGTRFEITGNNVVIENGTFKEVNGTLGRHNFYGTLSGVGASNVSINDVTVDGSNGAGMHFRINCTNFSIKRPRILNTKADGLQIQRGGSQFSIVSPYITATEDDCIGIVGHGRNEGYDRPSDVEILGGYLGAQANGAVGSGLAVVGATDVRAIGVKCESNGLSNIRITDFTDAGEGNYATSNVLLESPQCFNGGLTVSGLGGLVKDGITIANSRDIRVVNADVRNPTKNGVTVSNASIDVDITNLKVREATVRGLWVAATSMTASHVLELANDYGDGRYSSATSLKCEYLSLRGVDIQRSGDDGFYIDGATTGDVVNPTFSNIYVDLSNVNNTAGKYGIFLSDTTGLELSGANGGTSASGTAVTSLVFVNADYNRITGIESDYPSTTYPLRTRGTKREFYNGAIPSGAPTVGYPYELGEIIWNTNPASGTVFWICTATGGAGTWVAK